MDQSKIVGIIIRGIITICNELLTAGGNPPVPAATPLTAGGNPPVPAATPLTAGPGGLPTGMPGADAGGEETKIPPVDLDAEGLPWDARIHTTKKSKLTSGVWRIAPKTDKLLVAQVKSELTLAARAAAGANDQDLATGAGGDEETFTWANLISLIVEKGCAPDAVLAACKACGVDNIGKLQEATDKIPAVRVILGI